MFPFARLRALPIFSSRVRRAGKAGAAFTASFRQLDELKRKNRDCSRAIYLLHTCEDADNRQLNSLFSITFDSVLEIFSR